jgi:hypothetical protein
MLVWALGTSNWGVAAINIFNIGYELLIFGFIVKSRGRSR